MEFEVLRHDMRPLPPEVIAMKEDGLARKVSAVGPNNFSTTFSGALWMAVERCVGDPEVEFLETWESFVRAMQIGSAMFASAMPQDGDIERMIAHEMRPVKVTEPKYYSSAGNWLESFWLAVICREKDRMTELCQVPVDVLRQGAPDAFDEYVYSWVDALQCYWLRQGDVAEKLMKAMELTQPDELREGSREVVLHLMYPTIPVFIRFLQRDNDGFNEALAQALRWHKGYWDTEDRSHINTGTVALGPLAVACMARDTGVPVEVESGYMPKHLLEGSWLDEFPT